MKTKKNFAIFSFQLAKSLLDNGWEIVDISPNYQIDNQVVFYFKDCPEIREYVRKWNELKNI